MSVEPIGSHAVGKFKKSPASEEGRESSHKQKHQFSLNVVRENGNEEGTLYGLMISAPFYDPSNGIQFVFEGWHIDVWDKPVDGVFLVSIIGHNLQDISSHLKACTLDRIALGSNITEFIVKKIK